MKTGLLITIAGAVVIIAIIAAVSMWNEPRPIGERIDDSVNELQQGDLGNAAGELGNATYGEKIADETSQAYDSAKQSVSETYNDMKTGAAEMVSDTQQAVSRTF